MALEMLLHCMELAIYTVLLYTIAMYSHAHETNIEAFYNRFVKW